MSHYVDIETEITDQTALVRALERCGFKNKIEIHEKAVNLYGYRGDVREQKANVIIRRKYVGTAANDIGFEKLNDGTYKAHISEYDHNQYNKKWQKKLLTLCNVEKAKIECEKYNLQYTEDVDEKQRPRLRVIV
jgi:major membrane immunogen (membrane-anchored lipoprotein)